MPALQKKPRAQQLAPALSLGLRVPRTDSSGIYLLLLFSHIFPRPDDRTARDARPSLRWLLPTLGRAAGKHALRGATRKVAPLKRGARGPLTLQELSPLVSSGSVLRGSACGGRFIRQRRRSNGEVGLTGRGSSCLRQHGRAGVGPRLVARPPFGGARVTRSVCVRLSAASPSCYGRLGRVAACRHVSPGRIDRSVVRVVRPRGVTSV